MSKNVLFPHIYLTHMKIACSYCFSKQMSGQELHLAAVPSIVHWADISPAIYAKRTSSKWDPGGGQILQPPLEIQGPGGFRRQCVFQKLNMSGHWGLKAN